MESNVDWKFWLFIGLVFLVFFHKLVYAVGEKVVSWIKGIFKK